MLKNSVLLNFLFFISLQAYCTQSFSKDIESKKNYTFNYSFKDVWAAAQVILGSYPLETNDLNEGLIRTTPLKPGQFWQPPFEEPIDYPYSQTLTFQFFKLSPNRTQIQILKKAAIQTDFLGSEKKVQTEPWEELRITYKINREIEIKKTLAKMD